jgi:hypothetical protein
MDLDKYKLLIPHDLDLFSLKPITNDYMLIVDSSNRCVDYLIKDKDIRGTARCHPFDMFNEEIGKNIAKKRALIKINKKTIKRLKSRIFDVSQYETDIKYELRRIKHLEYILEKVKNELNDYINKCINGSLQEDEKIKYPTKENGLQCKFYVVKNKITVCTLTQDLFVLCNKFKGVSVCHENDNFDIEVGKTIAYKRALIKLLKKRLVASKKNIKFYQASIKITDNNNKRYNHIIKKLETRNEKLLNDIKKY